MSQEDEQRALQRDVRNQLAIRTRVPSALYQTNYEKIFGKKPTKTEPETLQSPDVKPTESTQE